MKWVLLALLVVAFVAAIAFWLAGRRRRELQTLADSREEALRWYERLGGQVMNLTGGDNPAARQALVDAGERYNAAGGQLDRAGSGTQYELARETALEGLAYARAARIALGLDPGPELPPMAGQRVAGAITKQREVDVSGHQYRASPAPGGDTPYYYPGGTVSGRPVPAGWYSEPWWKTALVAGAWGIGSILVFDALFNPGWGDAGYGTGFADGLDWADGHGGDPGASGEGGGGASDDVGAAGDFDGGGWVDGGSWSGGDGGDFGGDF